MSRVAIIGHFGGDKYFTDGQTVKTKELYAHIKRNGNHELEILDSYIIKYNLIEWIIKINKSLKKNNKVIVILSTRGYKIILPILVFLNQFYKRDIYDFVIGGSRHKHLKKNKLLSFMAKKCKFIYVESENMVKEYENIGVKNSIYVPNFKNLSIARLDDMTNRNEGIRKICTFSRVCKEKGIEDAIEAVTMVNERFGKIVCELDIYGKPDKEYVRRFEEIKLKFPNYIKYAGVVDYTKTVETLKEYYLLLFPTYHEGEGFPGTIVDAFAAGLPVIATDWNCNCEIIDDTVTGKIVPIKNVEKLKETLCYCLENDKEINIMKKNCLNEAYKYMPEYALKEFMDELNV